MSSFLLDGKMQQDLVNKINELLPSLVKNFSFYKKKLAGLSLKINHLDDLNSFPILDKKNDDAWGIANEALNSNPPMYFETSGTSGLSFPVLPDFSRKKNEEFAEFISKQLNLNGSSNYVCKAVIALPFEMNPIGLKYLFALDYLGITSIPVGVRTHLCPPKKVVEIILRLRPELLIARPMETLRYADIMLQSGQKPWHSSIKKIILTGEIISEAKFKRISKLFGSIEVCSVYGLTELDIAGMASCENYRYHLPSKPQLFVELLDDNLKMQLIKDGDIGNIVLTNTDINHMPLLRYVTGDRGILKMRCGCKKFNTPAINLLGRGNDVLSASKPDVFPIHLENIILNHDCVSSDYQIVSHRGNLHLNIEWVGSYEDIAAHQFSKSLGEEIFSMLGIKIQINIFKPSALANKLGIARSKAGTLQILDDADEYCDFNKIFSINYSCYDDL